jgi:hypothetical protein
MRIVATGIDDLDRDALGRARRKEQRDGAGKLGEGVRVK